MDTAAIVTTNANRTLAALHDRMPVIVSPESFDLWLDTAKVDAQTAAALLVPARDDLVEAYEVSPAVNRVANDDARLIEPLPPGAIAQPEPGTANVPRMTAKPKAPNKRSDEPTLF